MKRIAFLTDGWKRLVTYSWNIGIKESIAQYPEEILVYQYNSFGNWSNDDDFNQGEYNIFQLPDLSKFDGILLDATNVTDEKILANLHQKIMASKVPAVSLGKQMEGLYYVGIDNQSSITTLMNHLYDKHNCRSFLYAGGPSDNFDNLERQSTYIAFLRTKGLDVIQNPVWNNSYTFDSGKAYFEKIITENITIPDAIVCANDHIAAGIIHGAHSHGYQVPKDFIVTGFDNIDQSQVLKPHLTTVEQKREHIGSTGVEILFAIWQGKEVAPEIRVNNTCVYSQSCGCVNEDLVDYSNYISEFISRSANNVKLENELAQYQIELSVAKGYEDIFRATRTYILGQKCDGYMMVLDKRLLSGCEFESFPTDYYDFENFFVPVCIENGNIIENPNAHALHQKILSEYHDGILLYSPIHYENRTLGFMMIKDGDFLFDNPSYCNMLMYLSQALIRVYQSEALARENGKLAHLYKHDLLTGVFNRIAFSVDAENYLKALRKKQIQGAIAFVDADHFKSINDTFGHDRGDEVLIEIAQTLDNFKSNGFVYRYGGDEFIVVLGNDDNEVEKYLKKVHDSLRQHQISVSIGVVYVNPEDDFSIDHLIRQADEKMYEIKRRKKTNL